MARIVISAGAPLLFVLAAASVTGALAAAPTSMTIALKNYAYDPENLVLTAGATYRLHFTNNSSKDHDFNAPKFFDDAVMSAEDRAKIVNGGVEVKVGGAVDVSVTLPHAAEYPVTCTHFMHADLGMEGEITVK